jgi:glycosyltransferase involved in cell wall biosynthesis
MSIATRPIPADLRLAVVTNILAPYRVPFFEALSRHCRDFLVILLAERHSSRAWAPHQVPFATRYLPGIAIDRAGSVDPMHVNWGAWSALRQFSPDAVLGGGYTLAHLQAFAYCKANRRLYVPWGELVTTHATQQRGLWRAVRRLMIGNSRAFVASSSATRDAFRSYGADPTSVLVSLMPVGTRQIHAAAAEHRRAGTVTAIRSASPHPRFFCASRLVDAKGIPELIRAFAAVQFRIPTASLVIAGEGPQHHEYLRQVRALNLTNVRFVGQLPPAELAAQYAACDVFVFPTLHDTFGAVIPEAIAAGALVVGSIHAAAAPDFIVDWQSGFLADPRDVDSFSGRMLTAATLPPAERAAMVERAQKTMSADDVESSAESIVHFITKSLGRTQATARGAENEPAQR